LTGWLFSHLALKGLFSNNPNQKCWSLHAHVTPTR